MERELLHVEIRDVEVDEAREKIRGKPVADVEKRKCLQRCCLSL